MSAHPHSTSAINWLAKMRDVGGYRKFRAGFAAMMGQVQSTRSRFAWEPGEEGIANSLFSGAHIEVADIK